MDEHKARGPLGRAKVARSFVLGSLIGAAGTIATVRRVRTTQKLRDRVSGLAAFEDAPCFLEIVERQGEELEITDPEG